MFIIVYLFSPLFIFIYLFKLVDLLFDCSLFCLYFFVFVLKVVACIFNFCHSFYCHHFISVYLGFNVI